jgi:hypothetical protein
VRAKIEKAIIGMSQQKKAMTKQRLTSSVSIFFNSPYFKMRIAPRAPIPTTTMDQPMISHLKNSDNQDPSYEEIPDAKIPLPKASTGRQISSSFALFLLDFEH